MRELLPSEFYLSQNYPDPFDRRTSIKFCVAYKTRVRLDLCSDENEVVRRLLDTEKEAGTYEVELDSAGLAEGIYICVLRAGEFEAARRMNLIR